MLITWKYTWTDFMMISKLHPRTSIRDVIFYSCFELKTLKMTFYIPTSYIIPLSRLFGKFNFYFFTCDMWHVTPIYVKQFNFYLGVKESVFFFAFTFRCNIQNHTIFYWQLSILFPSWKYNVTNTKHIYM